MLPFSHCASQKEAMDCKITTLGYGAPSADHSTRPRLISDILIISFGIQLSIFVCQGIFMEFDEEVYTEKLVNSCDVQIKLTLGSCQDSNCCKLPSTVNRVRNKVKLTYL